MPRVSPQHEQEVRDRIVRAAIGVFAISGFHRATMQDVVRASGLSVGAIYTYFKGKSDLILAGCDLIADQELGELRERLATVPDYRGRITVALGYFFDQFEEQRAGRGTSVLRRRRRNIVTSTALLLQEGVVRGELPAWLDVESIAHAIAALLDGITLEATEDGAAYRREDAERRALAMLEALFAARDAAAPVPLEAVAPRSYEPLKGARAS
jgi:AcrR family transcriptional regulator